MGSMNKSEFLTQLSAYYQEKSDFLEPEINLERVIDTGWESEIFIYTLTHGPQSARKSVKYALRLLIGADFPSAEGEYKTLARLHKAGYPVPQVFHLGKPGEVFERPFIIMQCIEGGQYAHWFPKTPQDDLSPLRGFVALFRQLHMVDWRPLVSNPNEIDPPGLPYHHFDRQLAIFSEYFSKADLTSLEPVIGWLRDQREKTACERASIIHYDFHPDNILEDRDGKLYVVDWTSADISDYRFDLAWTLTLSLAYGGELRREMVMEEYERQMGEKIPALEVFEAAAIVRRIGLVMLSLRHGTDEMGMRPEAADAMRRDKVPLGRLYARLKNITGLALLEIQAFLDTL